MCCPRTPDPRARPARRAACLPGCGPFALALALVSAPVAAPAQQADGGTSWRAGGPGVNWSLRGRADYSITGDINRDLEPDNQEKLLTNALAAGLILDAETKRSLISTELGVRASYFLGEDPELDGDTRLDPRVAVRGIYRGKTYEVDGSLGLDVEQASLAQADDTGISAGETTQFTVNYSIGLAQQLDELNTLNLRSSGTAIDFDEDNPDLTPSRTVGVNAGWERQLTGTTTAIFDIGARQFDADDLVDTRSRTLDLLLTLSHRRTSRHTFGGSIGVTAVSTETTGFETDNDLSLTGGASLDYLFNNGTVGVDFTQSVEPSAAGELQSFSRLTSDLTYDVTDQQRLNLFAALSRRTPLGGTGDTFDYYTVGAGYGIDVTESVEMRVGYSFQGNNDSAVGAATGHQVLLSLGKSFDVIP